ncbi:hypoxanthine-guanine phosphoribosyltransferase [Piscirickettsia salmonis]|uniref:Hypoxanthine-guanine phosphoribosyltransferase n=2 Tax=Piscirickettsia salmonis TaxID=1238 RepID=A0A9Q6LTJ6_PISSA|nr:hypoxanthine-guanine phosphoribosyltransferase [Piscirickettsia salmonis]RNC77665.1 hypoxanthine-guanine phosphoribosyltransferase [Piscirickettsiaceae bacterium NZ-RLO2]ALA24873.1 hypoxanthine-guanine phosphoribosyltransferase [Piscirickettsia salmonis]QGN77464.1 Hypoxanthine-guanine phosphoribosyltransferase [Piscirickettsia salmonis]QGN81052.1 Hypoxanthine-guanine phosphoribosyltransferase [Piscirickettsia salmonis]QGN84675.1 Hypoxanthine-guanine phosphoribosyltransferase [Piscirickettsi
MMKEIEEIRQRSKCLFSKAEIDLTLDRMAQKIHEDYQGKNPLLLSVMVGGLILTAELLTRLDFPLQVDYVHATRYQGNIRGNELVWKVKPSYSLNGRNVLIVDDILDGGITLHEIVEFCKEEDASSVRSAVLLDKVETRVEGGLAHADYVGLEVANQYVFGYGMDYKNYLRNAPGIFAVPEELC